MKQFFCIFFALLLITTLSLCFTKPVMHKNIMVYDSAYRIVNEPEIVNEKQEIPLQEVVISPQVKKQELKTTENKLTKNISKSTPVKQRTKKTTQVKSVEKSDTVTKTYTEKKKEEKQTVQNSVQPKITETNKPEKTTTVKTEQNTKVLTEQEEIIAWNVWRSNLQNKIMQDVKLPVLPQGIVFRFTFTVDKYGKIYNIQTWSDNSSYTPYAIQFIAPAIRNCQGHSVLNFPPGTSRMVTDVKGGWKISEVERLSTPNDYNDMEKVKR